MTKPLRLSMPTVAGWIDDMRDAFGADMINAAIRAGLDGQATFYASENGQTVGTPFRPDPSRVVSGTDLQIGPMAKPKKERK